jgi:hypothetical protein
MNGISFMNIPTPQLLQLYISVRSHSNRVEPGISEDSGRVAPAGKTDAEGGAFPQNAAAEAE